jgi:hypothetical protein
MLDENERAGFRVKKEVYPDHRRLYPGETIRDDDLIYCWTTGVFHRADWPNWLGPRETDPANCVLVIRSTAIKTVKMVPKRPALANNAAGGATRDKKPTADELFDLWETALS